MTLSRRLFLTYAAVVLIFLVIIALGFTLLMRSYVDKQSLANLDDMTRPISVQIIALIRGNVTPRNYWPASRNKPTKTEHISF